MRTTFILNVLWYREFSGPINYIQLYSCDTRPCDLERLCDKRKTEHGSGLWPVERVETRDRLNRKGDVAPGEGTAEMGSPSGPLLLASEFAPCPPWSSFKLSETHHSFYLSNGKEGRSERGFHLHPPLSLYTWSPGECSSPVT